MPDLYEIVGVDRGADAAAIRSAYRLRAKRAHPDGGGSRGEFEQLTKAVNLLTDERRRRVYDETGRIEEPPPDNDLAEALQSALAEIDEVINKAPQRNIGIEELDLLGDARKGVKVKIATIVQRTGEMENQKTLIVRLARKFKPKRGKVDRIGPSFMARVRDVERALEMAHHDKKRMERALVILDDHEFDRAVTRPLYLDSFSFIGMVTR